MTKNRTDFLSKWQKEFAFGLGEVIFTEKDKNDIILSEVLMSTAQFAYIINYYGNNFKNLNPEDLIYKYHDRDFIGENEEWAIDSEVHITNVYEFLNQLLAIDKKHEGLNSVKEEFEFLINFCQNSIKNKTKIYFQADDY